MNHLKIGAIIFPQMDQMDLTGPFAVLSRLPDSTFQIVWKEMTTVRDGQGFILTPETTFSGSPQFDVLVVPGGFGQHALMEDETVLAFIRHQSIEAKFVFSICTGALLCGAAGLLRGIRTTTHWSAHHLLGYFGAIPENSRVVVDGKFISAAGVTAGFDGALKLAALLRGELVAQAIQLGIEYAPEPPFMSGTPRIATPKVLALVQAKIRPIAEARLATAKAFAARNKARSITAISSSTE
jgi:cyclohexyl-isocyanide hydratase